MHQCFFLNGRWNHYSIRKSATWYPLAAILDGSGQHRLNALLYWLIDWLID
jgi:hypothetical protein